MILFTGGERVWQGACVVGGVWWRGMRGGGMCGGGMCGRGHTWRGACVTGDHVWQGGMW